MSNSARYIGRFAPSPSGPLHFGSLLTAVASYLDAKANAGTWIVRMEDLDPAREPPGTDQLILQQLEDYGLVSDRPVLVQSQRFEAYNDALDALSRRGLCFACSCSRQKVRRMGEIYDGTCRSRKTLPRGNHAIRIKANAVTIGFEDLIRGSQVHELATGTGDFIIKRKDGLIAYQLAVVVDDAFQQITHVIRGQDLLDSTPRQIYLQHLLGFPTPVYGHVPVVINAQGQKLSKQHFAEPISTTDRRGTLNRVLRFLGLSPPDSMAGEALRVQLDWAISRWDIQSVPKLATMPDSYYK